ncbi:MAG: Clp protease N-terminal domain-containing protein [Gemmatimonadetes bacterium]|nr:Clp protease N-terminal domain-containing protein [Gemmatimonadota bacterium]
MPDVPLVVGDHLQRGGVATASQLHQPGDEREHRQREIELFAFELAAPDEVLAEQLARVARRDVVQLAADDASRQGQSAVTTENMLVGLLRAENGIFAEFFMGSGTDMPKLRERLGDRLLPDSDPLVGGELPAAADAALALQMAAAEADFRRRQRVAVLCLLYGILSQDRGAADLLLGELGTNKPEFVQKLRGAI